MNRTIPKIGATIVTITVFLNGEAGNGGAIALLCWCAYFFPVSILLHTDIFKKLRN